MYSEYRVCVCVRTLAVRMYKLNTSALIFNVCACRISRTTQKLVWKDGRKKRKLKKETKTEQKTNTGVCVMATQENRWRGPAEATGEEELLVVCDVLQDVMNFQPHDKLQI